ncbi:MAG TPA: histidinol-phosphate transaminase [Burkholderiaceae bacterium]|nr:histidinol-phosphate transaminase [Burkholderiaceae bacterium]
MTLPLQQIVRDDVLAIDAYHVPPAAGMVKLDAMENPFALPPALAEELGARLARVALNRYPPADPHDFKARLAQVVGLPPGMELMLGNGSDELIHLVIQACARPAATVLSPWPSFVMYAMSARFDGCRFVGVALRPDFSLDVAAMIAAIEEHRPAVVFLAYPNNPTGNLFDRADVEAILDAAPGLVVVDEAYLPFAQATFLDELRRRPRLLVLRTLSKLGLAGIRLGYLCGAPAWIREFDKVRPPYNVNVLTLAAADVLLGHLGVLDEQAAILRGERARVAAALRAVDGVEAFDSAANFILFRVARPDAVFAALKQRGILIKNVSAAHPLLSGCLRTTIGTGAENDAFLAALRGSL